jgi:hypothetical protein
MEFNRFDICAAYYHFAMLPVRSGLQYKYPSVSYWQCIYEKRLLAMKYRPGLSDSRLATISPNAKAIYMGLVRKYLK